MLMRHVLLALFVVLLLAGLPWRAAAQSPGPDASPTAAGPPGENKGEWNLSDLLDGIIKMEGAQLPLTHEQAVKIRPALQRVLDATRLMTESETRIKSVLTPEQIAFIEKKQRNGDLRPDAGLGGPRQPGEDPVVNKVVEILEKRAR